MSSDRRSNSRPLRSAPTTTWSSAASDIVDAVARVDTGAGVIMLTDMFGGTPSNLAISVMEAGRVEVIAGVNLPMLIKLASVRKADNMAMALDEAQAAGRKYINVASQRAERQMSGMPTARQAMSSATSPIINQRGLHARASAKFVQIAERLRRRRSSVEKDGVTVGGTSIMGLMMLAASPGCTIRVTRQRARSRRGARRARRSLSPRASARRC